MKAESVTDRLTMAAAAVGYFDPLRFGLQLATGEEHTEAMNRIADSCSEVEVDGAWYWTFQPDARRDALKNLAEATGRQGLLDAIVGDLHPKDSLGRYLIPAMSGDDLQERAEDGNRDPALLLATRLAVDSGVGHQKELEQAGRTVLRSMERTEADQVLATVRPERLVGRSVEYEQLMTFLRSDIPQDPLEVFTISGIGGVGKSALVSTFVHEQRQLSHRPPVIHLDFDRTLLTTGFGQTLTTELSHQLGLFDNGLGESMAELRAEFDGVEQSDFEAASRAGYSMLTSLKERLAGWEHRDRELVIVLDTFEEVLLRGPSVAESVLDWLHQLRDVARLGNLRPVIAGREVPRDVITNAGLAIWRDHGLEDLAPRDAIDLLNSLGTDAAQATRAVAVFGGNPLVLRMFSRFRANNTALEVDQLLLEAEAKRAAIGDSYEAGPTGTLAVQFLTERILNRLSEDLRTLASPGLVLRKVNRDLVQQVLAEPCGLGELTDQSADELLERLAGHVWLVHRSADGELRHRRDIRRMMLPGILASDADRAEAIHRNAVAFYTSGPGATTQNSGIEADYHRGFLFGDSGIVDPWVTPAPLLLAAIGADIQDWQTPARALLRGQAEDFETISVAETQQLSGEKLSKARTVRVDQSLAYGDVSHARGVADQIKIAPGEFDASSLRLDFAEYQFERVVEQGDEALRWYFETGVDESKVDVWSDTALHEHIPWLVALSSLAVDGEPLQFGEAALTAVHRRHSRTGGRPYPTLLALAVARLIGDTRAALSFVSVLAGHDRISMPQPRVESQVHLLQLCEQAPGGNEVVRAMTVDRLSSLAPLRRTALERVLASMPLSDNDHAKVETILRNDQERTPQAGLTELNDTIRTLQQISVPLTSGAALAGLPTHLPQLHRTCRVLLSRAEPDWLMARLETLGEDRRWPVELTADAAGHQVNRKQVDSHLMASVVETADRLGLLRTLLAPSDGAAQDGAPRDLERTARVVDRFEAALGQDEA